MAVDSVFFVRKLAEFLLKRVCVKGKWGKFEMTVEDGNVQTLSWKVTLKPSDIVNSHEISL